MGRLPRLFIRLCGCSSGKIALLHSTGCSCCAAPFTVLASNRMLNSPNPAKLQHRGDPALSGHGSSRAVQTCSQEFSPLARLFNSRRLRRASAKYSHSIFPLPRELGIMSTLIVKLDFHVSYLKSSTSKFLIDNFCAHLRLAPLKSTTDVTGNSSLLSCRPFSLMRGSVVPTEFDLSGIIPLSRIKKTCPSTNTFATNVRRATSASSQRPTARPNARNAAASARRFSSPLSQRARATALQLQVTPRLNPLRQLSAAVAHRIRVDVTEKSGSFSDVQLRTSNLQDVAATSLLLRRESQLASRRVGVLVSRVLNLTRSNFHTGACHAWR